MAWRQQGIRSHLALLPTRVAGTLELGWCQQDIGKRPHGQQQGKLRWGRKKNSSPRGVEEWCSSETVWRAGSISITGDSQSSTRP